MLVDINDIINSTSWKFALIYNKLYPHEYAVRGRTISEGNFCLLCDRIKKQGEIQYFFKAENKYLSIGNYTYWVVGNVVNRRLNRLYYLDETKHIKMVKGWKKILFKEVDYGED